MGSQRPSSTHSPVSPDELRKATCALAFGLLVFASLGGLVMMGGGDDNPGESSGAAIGEESDSTEGLAEPSRQLIEPSTTETTGPFVGVAGLEEVPAEVVVAQTAARSEQGARDAAVAILELTEEAVQLTPTEAAQFQRRFATAAFADQAAAQTEQQMVELRSAVPEGVTLRLAPIAVHSVADGNDGWIVSIWFVEAITIGTQGVVDDWRTATYTMRWEDHAWKVDAFDSIRGPMPGRGTQPASATPIQFEALLTGFDDEGLN